MAGALDSSCKLCTRARPCQYRRPVPPGPRSSASCNGDTSASSDTIQTFGNVPVTADHLYGQARGLNPRGCSHLYTYVLTHRYALVQEVMSGEAHVKLPHITDRLHSPCPRCHMLHLVRSHRLLQPQRGIPRCICLRSPWCTCGPPWSKVSTSLGPGCIHRMGTSSN